MKQKYQELNINRDFSDILSTYLNFIKWNIVGFTKGYLKNAGLLIITLILASYFITTGVMELIAIESSSNFGTNSSDSYLFSIGIGGLLFFIIIISMGIYNYGLSSLYLIKYDTNKDGEINFREVITFLKPEFGKLFLFLLTLIPLMLIGGFISVAVSFIPLFGIFVNYFIQFLMTAWFGISVYALLKEDLGIFKALGKGWKLVTGQFWKCIGINAVIGFITGVLLIAAMIIPGILLGVYTYHVVESEIVYSTSIIARIVYSFGVVLFVLMAVFTQCLGQFANGMLYHTLTEAKENNYTRAKIDQIGTFRD